MILKKTKSIARRMNAILCCTIAMSTILANVAPALAQQPTPPSKTERPPIILRGGINFVVPQGTNIKLKLAQVPTTGMKLMDRDLNGDLFPAELGQEITAKTTEDIFVDDNKVIPEGTIFHGTVSKILPPRRLSREGSLSISFDHLTTPDGRLFKFNAEANNQKASTVKTKSKGLGIIAAHAAGGAIVGALVAYQVFGMHNTIAMHGYNIAGGAAGGALIATAFIVMRKGPKARLEPGDDLNMQIDTDLLMPAAAEPVAKKDSGNIPGVNIQVEKSKILKDGLEGYILRLDVVVHNDSPQTLSSMDVFMEDGNGTRNPVCAGAETDFENTEYLFTVPAHSTKKLRLNFQVEYPKLQRQLVWLDHESRYVCYRQKLP